MRYALVLVLLAWVVATSVARAADPADLIVPPDVSESDFDFTTADGVQIKGVLVLPRQPAAANERLPVAILIHPLVLDRDSVRELADELARRGIGSVAFDLRGHGRSRMTTRNEIYSFPLVPTSDLRKAIDDLRLIIARLRITAGVDAARLSIVGCGEGALIASEVAARTPELVALALIDPSEPLAGFDAARDLTTLAGRPALLVCSGFPQSAERVRMLANFGRGERSVKCVETFAKSARLLTAGGPATLEVATWLGEKAKAPR